MINHYCQQENSTFVDVAQDNGISIHKQKMSAEYAAAMLSKANVGAAASWVLNKYLTAFLSRRIMPSEKAIYRGDIADDKLPPTILTKQLDDNTKYNSIDRSALQIIQYYSREENN